MDPKNIHQFPCEFWYYITLPAENRRYRDCICHYHPYHQFSGKTWGCHISAIGMITPFWMEQTNEWRTNHFATSLTWSTKRIYNSYPDSCGRNKTISTCTFLRCCLRSHSHWCISRWFSGAGSMINPSIHQSTDAHMINGTSFQSISRIESRWWIFHPIPIIRFHVITHPTILMCCAIPQSHRWSTRVFPPCPGTSLPAQRFTSSADVTPPKRGRGKRGNGSEPQMSGGKEQPIKPWVWRAQTSTEHRFEQQTPAKSMAWSGLSNKKGQTLGISISSKNEQKLWNWWAKGNKIRFKHHQPAKLWI